MTSSGAASHTDSCGIDMILRRIRAQPADRSLAILHRRWKAMRGGQTVGNGRSHVAAFGQSHAKLVIALPGAGAKSPTMNAEDDGERAVTGLRLRQIELEMLIFGIGEFDRPLECHVIRHDNIGSAG